MFVFIRCIDIGIVFDEKFSDLKRRKIEFCCFSRRKFLLRKSFLNTRNAKVEPRMNSIVQHRLYVFLKAFERFRDDPLTRRSSTVSNRAERENLNGKPKRFSLLRPVNLVEHDKHLIDIEQCLWHHLNKPNVKPFDRPEKKKVKLRHSLFELKEPKNKLDLSFSHNPNLLEFFPWPDRIFCHRLNNKSLNLKCSSPYQSEEKKKMKIDNLYFFRKFSLNKILLNNRNALESKEFLRWEDEVSPMNSDE